ncbi:MAG TPA: DNA polymerase III subunit [Acidobacteriaceae bacterium]|jgi:DNA polymerase-3 subunit delta'|nr:DNA polymerase III subunit [Acidobacteriaceae bacterium]
MTSASSLPGTFNEFLGNSAAVESLRTAIAAGRLPHSVIIAGPAGAGKYTLALMVTMAVECLRQPRDLWSNGQVLASFCGNCANCTRISTAANLEEQVDAAVAIREELRETDKKDTRVLIQPHPDVLIIPPDPPQLLIKLGQVRTLIQRAHYLPAEAPRRIFILTASTMMKEAANSILKVLEEPPETAHIIILAENTGELLPTIRSRCALVRLGALPVEEIEMLLADRRPEVLPQQRALIARLSQGAAGRALSFDLDTYVAARADAMIFLRNAAAAAQDDSGTRGPAEPDHTALFKMTETYRAGAEGQQKTVAMLRTLALLLEDMLLIDSGTPELLRNTDLRAELTKLAQTLSFHWIEKATHALDQVHSGMRRNLLRSLSLDSFAGQLASTSP